MGGAKRGQRLTALEALTRREREIAERLGRGLTIKEIAHELGISTSTVKNHIHSAIQRSGARSRTHLAVLVATGAVVDHSA